MVRVSGVDKGAEARNLNVLLKKIIQSRENNKMLPLDLVFEGN